MYNKNLQNGKGMVWLFLLVSALLFAFLFFGGYFGGEKDSGIVIDKDNTEIIAEKKDLKEIEDRLNELDIDLDDVLSELEF